MSGLRYPIIESTEIKTWVQITARKPAANILGANPNQDNLGSVIDTVHLLAPNTISESNAHAYEVITQRVAGAAAQAFSSELNLDSTVSGVGGTIRSFLDSFDPTGAMKQVSKLTGSSVNPREEKLYKQPQFRSFTLSWELAPQSNDESNQLTEIINTLRRNSYPTLKGGSRYLFPSEFSLEYYSKGGIGGKLKSIGRIGKCVLESVSVNYTGAGFFQKYDEGGAAFVNLDLQFSEAQLLHQDHKAISGDN
jgi:hypothetical protein